MSSRRRISGRRSRAGSDATSVMPLLGSGASVDKPIRNPIVQQFLPFAILATATPTPLLAGIPSANRSSLYTTIAFSIQVGGNSVIIGDSSVSPALSNGQWITPGVVTRWRIINERQLYEVQSPLVDQFQCVPDSIPIVVWDMQSIYLAAAVN